MFLLLLLLGSYRVEAEEDCVAGDWEEWTTCVETGVELLQSKGVGKVTRSRMRISGAHCEKQDLIETKLCVFGDSSESDGSDSSSEGGDPKTDDAEGAGGEERGGGIAGEGGDGTSKSEHDKSDSAHLTKDKTERTVLITLLTVSAALLLTGTVVGSVLIRQHRNLQRRHKVLVMTKERVRLIDGKKLPVRKSAGGMLCGFEPQFTIHNPIYESEGEDEQWTRASRLPSGNLKLQSS